MKLKKILPQFATLLVVVLIFGFFTMNAQLNMDNRGIDFGYGFLSQESSFDVQFSLIEYSGSDSYARAYLVGLLNTLLVSVLGIILCTLIGVVIGIARLSPNYLIRTTSAWYVEFFRNIPLLLQIFFWYYAALRALPLPQDAEAIFGSFYLTIKGFYTPSLIWENLDIFIYSVVAGIVSIIFVRIHARKLRENEGRHLPVLNISIAILFIFPLLTFLFGGVNVGYETPELKQLAKTSFKFDGGLSIPPELLSLVIAITNDNSSGGILKPPSNLNDVFANCLSSGVSYPTLTPPNKNVKSGNINKIAIEMFKTGKCLPSFSLSFLA